MATAAGYAPSKLELDAHVSENRGQGADSMSSFIHEHLASILKPFAEQLDELRSLTGQLRQDLDDTTSRAHNNSQGLQEAKVQIKAVKADLEISKNQADAVKKGHDSRLEELSSQCVVLLSDVQKITDLEHRHHVTRSAMLDLQQANKATRLDINRLISDMKDADGRLAEQYSTTLDQVQAEVSGLDRSLQNMARDIIKLEAPQKQHREDFNVFLEGNRRQRRKDDKIVKDTNASLASLSNRLDTLDVRFKTQANFVSAVKEDLTTLERRHGQTMKMQTVQERQQTESNERQASFKQQLEVARTDLLNVMYTLGLCEGTANLVESINKLFKTTEEQGASLQEHQHSTAQSLQSHQDQLTRGVQRANDMDACVQEIQESRKKVETRMAEKVEFVERMIHGNEEKSKEEFDRVAAEAAERAELAKQYAQKFEQQAAHNQRTSGQLQNLEGDLEKKGMRIDKLEGRASSIEERVSKLDGSMDLNQEYWKGLTRGFHETHRRVAVDRDLLSPRTTPRGFALESEQQSPQRGAQSPMLPAITKTV